MRPVSAEHRISQGFGSMKTQGVAPSSTPGTVGWYVKQYGNYQPFGHAGCDIACPEGTPVHAISSGTVLWADWGTKLPGDESNFGYRRRWYLYKGFPGIVTVIQHAGWIGVYAHLSAAHMNVGDAVTEAQVIGLSGGTGGVAPHLHVEALIDTSYKTGGGLIYGRTDPEPFFGSAAIAPQGTTTPSQEDDMPLTQQDKQEIAELTAKEVAANANLVSSGERHNLTHRKLDEHLAKNSEWHNMTHRKLDVQLEALTTVLAAGVDGLSVDEVRETLRQAVADSLGRFEFKPAAGGN